MTDILVKRLTLLPTSTRGDVGRFFEIEPIPCSTLSPGFRARFFAVGKKDGLAGVVVEMPGGILALDTFIKGDK